MIENLSPTMWKIIKFLLILSIFKIVQSFNWETLKYKKIKLSNTETFKLRSLSEQRQTIATFNVLGTRENDRESNGQPITIRIVMQKDDENDTSVREIIEEFYQITEQLPHIYAYLNVEAKLQRNDIAFLAFDNERLSHNLTKLEDLDLNKSLIGADVKDYVNLSLHPKQSNKCLSDFKLDLHIPSKESDNADGVFYSATIQKASGSMLKHQTAIVIIPLRSDNIKFLENEIVRFEARTRQKKPFYRFAKSGYINGRVTPFLVVQLVYGCMTNSKIKGLNNSYLTYIDFIDDEIFLSAWERIYIDNKDDMPYFHSLRLTDYSQDPKFDWGLFKSTIMPLNETDPRGIVDVNVKVLWLSINKMKDTLMQIEYDKMLDEKDKYEFLCYCPDAKIGQRRVAFVAYKQSTEFVIENDTLMKNADVEINSSLKRKRNSSEAAIDPQI